VGRFIQARVKRVECVRFFVGKINTYKSFNAQNCFLIGGTFGIIVVAVQAKADFP